MTDTTDFFGGRKAKREIPPEVQREVIEQTDERFPDRTPHRLPPKRQRGTTKQLHNFTMRLDIDDMSAFIRWADAERLSYREAFGRLVAHLKG